MKILTVCSSLGIGGIERAAQNYTLGYHRAGHHVAFLNWGFEGVRQKILENHDIRVFAAGGDLADALKKANGFDPDIIHIHRRGWCDDREIYILEKLHKKGRRVIEQNVFGGVDYSPASDLIDVHLQLSKWCMWRWRRLLGVKQYSTAGVIAPNPVNPEDFNRSSDKEIEDFRSQFGIDKDAYVCGRIGQPIDGKWHPQTLIAFAELARLEKKAILLLIGMPESYQKILKSLPSDIQKRIFHIPLIYSDDELRKFYSSLDCFIHAANQGESFGYVLTEAMMCGCPVVTVNQPHKDNSQVEVVGHLQGGLVAGSMKQLSNAVIMLWSNPDLRKKIRKNARKHVLSRFDMTKIVSDVLRVAEITLESDNRMAIMRSLEKDEPLKTKIEDKDICTLYHNTIGSPSLKELFIVIK